MATLLLMSSVDMRVTVQYYTAILRQEDSVEINPIRDKNDREKIIYHSLYLKHIR